MSQQHVGVFPGSFDPFTKGHEEVVREAIKIFDRLIIVIGLNATKRGFLAVTERLAMIKATFASEPQVSVTTHNGLIADFLKTIPLVTIVRGLRSEADFTYEMPMAVTNKILSGGISTIFIPTKPENRYLSSSLVREVASHGGVIDPFVPEAVKDAIYQAMGHVPKAP